MAKKKKSKRPIGLLESSLKKLNAIVKSRGGKAFAGSPKK